MKHERATEELREVTALYVLGSLTQQEARGFENHIKEGCTICEAERRKYERAITAIGLSAEETAPPEYIRDLLSARIEREPQAAPPAAPASQAVEETPVVEVSRRPNSPSFSFASQPRRERSNFFPWVLAAILAILGLSAAYAWKSARELNMQLQARISSGQADVDDLRTKLDIQKISSGSLDQILSMAGKPGASCCEMRDRLPAQMQVFR